MLRSFWQDETGATSIEYALIAAGIFLVCVLAISTLGDTVRTLYERVSDGLAAPE